VIEAARISEERYHCYVGAGLPITMGEQFYINYSHSPLRHVAH